MRVFVVKNRMLYFYTGCVLVFVTLALFGYYAVDQNGHFKRPVSSASQSQDFVTDMAYYDLPRMTVAVGRGVDEAHVRLEISLEIPKEDLFIMEGFQPRVTDRLTDFLATLHPDQFQRTSSLPWLRGEMLQVVNSAGAPFPVHNIFLRQMLIM